MNGPSARALREGGMGGSIPYKTGVTLYVKPKDNGPVPKEWLRKTTLQAICGKWKVAPFGDFGQILRIDVSETQRCAYVEYEDSRDAQDAAKDLDGKKIAGKEVSVVLASAAKRTTSTSAAAAGPPSRAVDLEQRVAELAMKHFLDDAAAARLASVFQDRSRLGCDLVRDFQDLDEHLSASNKPSALVSMKLSELRSGRPIGLLYPETPHNICHGLVPPFSIGVLMPPKGKAKSSGKAKADAKVKAKASAKKEDAVQPQPVPKEVEASPAAGSGTAAVRQQREVDISQVEATPEPEKPEENRKEADLTPAVSAVASPEPVEQEESKPAKPEEPLAPVDLSCIADPWGEVTDEDAMGRIKEEDWEVIEADSEASDAAAQLNAKDKELQKFCPTDSQRSWLVSADLSENQLTTIPSLGGPMWLRHLNLGMNPMESLDGLGNAFPRLLVLDVSFIELSSMDGAWKAFSQVPRLRRLVAEGCSISSFEDLVELPSLKTLEVNDNAIEELQELDVLAKKCKALLELDFRENEVADLPGYAKKIAKCFPHLTWLDNQSRKKYVAKGANATYSADALKEKDVIAVDGMFKNESCSCLEGNPCLDRATCKDWANREKVAAEARKRKGLRDDSGKML
eukprot:symbB.v1.2.006512.t1/scaffold380.1/size216529/2